MYLIVYLKPPLIIANIKYFYLMTPYTGLLYILNKYRIIKHLDITGGLPTSEMFRNPITLNSSLNDLVSALNDNGDGNRVICKLFDENYLYIYIYNL